MLKKTLTKNGWWMAQAVGPKFKPQYCQQNKKKETFSTSFNF
jgi:hypothetical protein